LFVLFFSLCNLNDVITNFKKYILCFIVKPFHYFALIKQVSRLWATYLENKTNNHNFKLLLEKEKSLLVYCTNFFTPVLIKIEKHVVHVLEQEAERDENENSRLSPEELQYSKE